MTLLRNGRGRLRCYFDDCSHWASSTVLTATAWSVAERVPICQCCDFLDVDECEGGTVGF